MKNIHFVLFFLLSASLNAQTKLWLVDPLEAIYPDVNNLSEYGNTWKMDFARGSVAEVHILINAPKGEDLTFAAYLSEKELPIKFWSRLIDVPVEQNTGLDSRTEAFINKKNPYVVRRAPFQIYEAIQPVKTNRYSAVNNFTALRLAIPSGFFTSTGKHKISIEISGADWQQKASFTVVLHPASIPKLSESLFFYTNWFNLKRMEEKHQVERWTKPWFSVLDKYAELMAYGRQNCILVPGELIYLKGDKIVLDEKKMLQFIDVFRKHGFTYFESPHMMYRGDGDDWGDPELKVRLTKKGYFSEDGKRDIERITTLVKEFTEKNDLTKNWLQHISDEPTNVQAKCYRDVVAQVKSIYPEVKIMEATNDRDGIVGAIDLWCPLINDFQENEAFFRNREKEGEKVLVYTCLVPGGKWLNRTLDMEKLRQVYFGWGAAHYNTFGYLHWGLNQFYGDPFEQSVIHHPSPVASANNFLPAGDTHVVYPGKEGPLSSIRFEAHRIGIEDYELLQELKKQEPALHDTLIKKLFRSYTDYNISTKAYRKVKKKLLKKL
ncbi:MAG: DUF4091 domain-containing protein [Bacteroidetes bacterium]|nr:DUF4091 domain-containing protein [Bacteroidota bacterium]